MLDYTLPMTAEERTFAEKHHGLIASYLRAHKLPVDEYYDIAVFGYLRAVRKYLARPELRQYQFATIAYRAMSCDVHHSREYWTQGKRNGTVCQLDEDKDVPELRDTVWDTLENKAGFERLARRITPVQRRIAALRADGYSDKEIADVCGLKRADVAAEMEKAQSRILMFQTDYAAMAA